MTIPITLVSVLQGAPDRALRSLASLAGLRDAPEHDVVLVADGAVGLDDLLARVEGDVRIVRRPERGGVLAALTDALDGLDDATRVVLLRDAPEVTPSFLGPLVAPLTDDSCAAATAGGPEGLVAPVAAHVLAARAGTLRAALPQATAHPVAETLSMGALVAALARHGSIEPVGASVVLPTAGTRLPAGLGEAPELSIVIPTLDAASDRVRDAIEALAERTDAPHEVIVVDNGAAPQGFTAPVNAGLRAARGAYLVVMNDDVEVLPGWWEPQKAALDAGATVTFPLTIDGAMRTDFAAWCFAMTRATLDEFGVAPGEFFDPALCVWYQDTDLLHRLRLAGRPPQLVAEAMIRHGLSQTVATPDPALRAWIDARILEDKAAFESRWGTNVAGAAR